MVSRKCARLRVERRAPRRSCTAKANRATTPLPATRRSRRWRTPNTSRPYVPHSLPAPIESRRWRNDPKRETADEGLLWTAPLAVTKGLWDQRNPFANGPPTHPPRKSHPPSRAASRQYCLVRDSCNFPHFEQKFTKVYKSLQKFTKVYKSFNATLPRSRRFSSTPKTSAASSPPSPSA
ncbi:hypothetical protein M885DRAFT_525927 [Pelagophyceae sp. CCMP2097]|nr:hypothetical protein M885DRAFT_525927 [Pelagophyceae sp. CCMP2097]